MAGRACLGAGLQGNIFLSEVLQFLSDAGYSSCELDLDSLKLFLVFLFSREVL